MVAPVSGKVYAVLRRRLAACGLTEFQAEVLVAVSGIPRGETRTYSEIAAAVGRPRACRAVGNALACNPFAPEIPCHRIVRSDGVIGGYSGSGGVRAKRRMLLLESKERGRADFQKGVRPHSMRA